MLAPALEVPLLHSRRTPVKSCTCLPGGQPQLHSIMYTIMKLSMLIDAHMIK